VDRDWYIGDRRDSSCAARVKKGERLTRREIGVGAKEDSQEEGERKGEREGGKNLT